ncbi:surface-adhesin E family protein [Haemophilus parainfluenzae]|uniref:surface-adhesin E family protein n=1 Tax=Haemophilus parainfluenzae TaxID=729 RepID=UPI0018A39537|nr:surface-adhesin E family protein [Haemophilus parainfluenzae]QOR11947.1 hypothetical protein INP97_01340 [Haemophilus parainfluenzae]
MKTKFVYALMILLVTPLSFAQLDSHWKYLGHSTLYSYYGNTRDRMTAYGFEAAWILENNEKGGSQLRLDYANCKTGHLGIAKIINYSNRDLGGYVIDSVNAPEMRLNLILPDTISETIYNFICNELY